MCLFEKRGGKRMDIKFSIMCNICKQPLKENETLLSHIKAHDPTDFFILIPILEWEEIKPKK